MKNNTPIAFNFNDLAVRIIPDVEQPLFVAKDVAVALGYADTVNAIKQFCKGVVKHHPLSTNGGKQEIRVIDEPDVYRLIFGSKLKSAEKFQNWVFEEVLPSIRKTGSYGANQSSAIRLHETRVKLLKELHKADSQPMRESIYQSLTAISKELDLPLLPLDEFEAEMHQIPIGHFDDETIREVVERTMGFFKNNQHLIFDPEKAIAETTQHVGYRKDNFYYIYPTVFNEEIAKNLAVEKVKEILHELDWLQKSADKRWVKQLYGKKIGGGRKRLGCFLEFSGIQPKKYN